MIDCAGNLSASVAVAVPTLVVVCSAMLTSTRGLNRFAWLAPGNCGELSLAPVTVTVNVRAVERVPLAPIVPSYAVTVTSNTLSACVSRSNDSTNRSTGPSRVKSPWSAPPVIA